MSDNKNLEFKSLDIALKSYDEVKGIFTGYAASFNKVDAVNDTISPEAFDISIAEFEGGFKKIFVNYDHYNSIILSDNLISMKKDDYGLLVEIKISEEARQDYSELFGKFVEDVKSGNLFMSIGGYVKDSKLGSLRWDKKMIANANDTIYKFDLEHVAFTNNPIDSNAKMLEVKSKVLKEETPNLNELINSITGEVSAIQFLTTYKSQMSNTNARNFIYHCKSFWKKEVDNKEIASNTDKVNEVERIEPCRKNASANGDELFEDIAKYL